MSKLFKEKISFCMKKKDGGINLRVENLNNITEDPSYDYMCGDKLF